MKNSNFVDEICERETISKTFSNYIAALDCLDRTLLILSSTSGGVSTGATVAIACASLGLVFPISNGIAKKTRKKTNEKKEKKLDKVVLLVRRKLINIDKIISKGSTDYS